MSCLLRTICYFFAPRGSCLIICTFTSPQGTIISPQSTVYNSLLGFPAVCLFHQIITTPEAFGTKTNNMKTLFTFLIATLFTTFSFAQSETCDCKKDLDFLVKKMKKTPGYKHQIKNKKEAEFTKMYTELASKMTSEISVTECFKLLTEQINTVKDYHSKIAMNREYFSKEDLNNIEKVTSFKNSVFFKNLPRTEADIEQLKETLSQKPNTSFEGIYSYGDDLVIGIVKTDAPNSYEGVVLESNVTTWDVGQINFYATQNEDGRFDFFNYELNSYTPRYMMNITFANGRVWGYKKTFNKNNHEFYTGDKGNWIFKELQNGVQYIRISHFSGSRNNRKAQKEFYTRMEKELTAPYVILDLRDNGGGSYEVSDPFLKLFKQKNTTVYVLTNMYTASNAEQFTAKLLNENNAIHVGQETFGVVAYGSDKEWPSSPSKKFTFRMMDMDFHDQFFQYEGKGITPSTSLNFDTEWITQTLELITNKKQS